MKEKEHAGILKNSDRELQAIIDAKEKQMHIMREQYTKGRKLPGKSTSKTRSRVQEDVVIPFVGHKLVHLDLKGAPPKMDYLLQFVPFVKSLGGTGFLIEYEDMFPFTGKLEILRRKEAYTDGDVKILLGEIKKQGMITLPLLQSVSSFFWKHIT